MLAKRQHLAPRMKGAARENGTRRRNGKCSNGYAGKPVSFAGAQATNGHADDSQAKDFDKLWDTVTQRLVDVSAVAFIFLLLPQLIKNAKLIAAGNGAALSGLAWEGFGTALMANTQLLGYFVDKGESSATAIQAIGVVSNYAVLFQMALAGHLPPVLTQGLALAAASTLGMLVLRFAFSGWRLTQNAWHAWQALLAIIGVVTVPQVLAGTFLGVQTLWPAYLSAVPAAALLVLDATGKLSGRLANLWSMVSAWTATMLFCCQPIAQLARNFAYPETVSSLSTATVLLATAGNGMMVPRALFTQDLVWSVGSLWGSLAMGWGNMLCKAMASSVVTGRQSFGWRHFSIASAIIVVYFAAVLIMQLRAMRRKRAKQA